MIQQIRRFVGVGLLAAVIHVSTALLVASLFGVSPVVANLAGFAVAVGVSYLGHARVTFEKDARDRRQLLRFVTLALAGLVLSSGITALVCSALGGPLLAAQVAVAVAVPMLSFVGSKFWAFAD